MANPVLIDFFIVYGHVGMTWSHVHFLYVRLGVVSTVVFFNLFSLYLKMYTYLQGTICSFNLHYILEFTLLEIWWSFSEPRTFIPRTKFMNLDDFQPYANY